jgi:hypothetical protein
MVHPMSTVNSLQTKLIGLVMLCAVIVFTITPLAVRISPQGNAAPAGCHRQAPAPTPEPVGHHCCIFEHHPVALTGFTADFASPLNCSHLSADDTTLITSSLLPSSAILMGSSPPGTAPLRI